MALVEKKNINPFDQNRERNLIRPLARTTAARNVSYEFIHLQTLTLIVLCFVTDPSGKVHPEITNKNGNPNYKYFYSNAEQGDRLQRLDKGKLSVNLCFFFSLVLYSFHSCVKYERGAGQADRRQL